MTEQFFRQPSEKPTILIVDDESVIRNLCKRALPRFKFLEAADGREALELISDKTVDLILTDVVMPEVGGLELLRCARDMYPDQSGIIMTGNLGKEIVLEALQAGASDFIYKPIDKESLQKTVEKVLKQKEVREELASYRRLDAFKNEFLSLITHKLKTPLTSFSLFVDAVDRGAAGIHSDAAVIKKELVSYDAILSDLLRYSKVLAGYEVSEPERVFSETFFYEIFMNCQGKSQKKAQQFEYQPEGSGNVLSINRARIAFAITALVENAIKFTPEKGSVILKTEMNDSAISVVVSDSGPGIDAAELPKVFEKFYQVDPDMTGQIPGLGLGLFFARQFVELDEGTLRLERNNIGGIDARVILPRK